MLHLGVQAVLVDFPDRKACSILEPSLKAAGFEVVFGRADAELATDANLFVVFIENPEQDCLTLAKIPPDALKIAVVSGGLLGGFAIRALRDGYSNVFSLNAVALDTSSFDEWLGRMLRLTQAVIDGSLYQKQLEQSIEELKEDQRAAYLVQKKLLPVTGLSVNGLLFQYDLMPSLIVSGDFVDVLSVNKSLTVFYLADVSGHGASSALVTVLLKNLMSRLVRNFRRQSSFDILSTKRIAERINSEIVGLSLDKHLTVIICLFDSESQTLLYTVAGHHPAPILVTRDSCVELNCQSMAVGLFPSPLFYEASIMLPADFALVLCSDGVFESLPEGDLDSKRHKLSSLVKSMANDFTSLSRILIRTHESRSERADDLTVMHISRGSL